MSRIGFMVLLALFAFPVPLRAQDPPVAPLEGFVREVARFWSEADVPALVDLMPENDDLTLDTGTGIETANSRHAAAALRAMFSESETVGANAVRVTVSSAQPPRGFGEIAWTFRVRGAPAEQSRSVYVGARWDESEWKITELRIMR